MFLGQHKKDSIRFSAVNAGTQVLLRFISVPLSIIVASVLGPALLGALKIFELIRQYASYNQFGTLQAMLRQTPVALSQKKPAEASRIQNMVFSVNVTVTIITILLLWTLYAVGFTFDGILNFFRMSILTLTLALQRVDAYLNNYVKAIGDFSLLTRRQVMMNCVTPFLVFGGVILWRLDGALLAVLITTSLGIAIYLHSGRLRRPCWYLPWKEVFSLISLGVKLFINKVADGIFWTVDMTIIAIFLLPVQVGHYGFALGIVGSTTAIVSMFTMMLYRHMLENKGQRKGQQDFSFMKQYLENPMAGLIVVSTLYLVLAYFGTILIVDLYLPKYRESLACLPVLALGQIFFLAASIPSICMNVGDHLERRLVFTVIGLSLNALLDIALINGGYGIIGAAWASTVSFGVYSVVIIMWVRRQVYGNVSEPLVFLIKFMSISLFVFFLMVALRDNLLLTAVAVSDGNFIVPLKILDAVLKVIVIWTSVILGYFLLFHKQKLVQECCEAARYLLSGILKKVRLSFSS